MNASTLGTTPAVGERRRPTVGQAARSLAASEYFALIILLGGLVVWLWAASPYFMTYNNIVNILTNTVVGGILAIPLTMLMIGGQIDLSIGAGAAFLSVVMAQVGSGQSIWLAVLVVVALGIVIGCINGFIVTVVGVNSLIATLGTMAIMIGLAKIASGNRTVSLRGFSTLGLARPFASIPLAVLILVAALIAGAFTLRFTVYGRQLYAVGGNQNSARLVGIRSGRLLFVTFALSGMAISLGALIAVSKLGAGSPNSAVGLELQVVTAVVLGGTSLNGGRGTIFGTSLGLLIIGTLNTGLILLNIEPSWQDVARGVLLIVALSFDQIRIRISGRRRVPASVAATAPPASDETTTSAGAAA